METKRPTLNDKEEYALIKQVYFKDNRPLNDEMDSIERLERQDAKIRQSNKSSR